MNMDFGRYYVTISNVNPGEVANKLFLIAFIHVILVEKNMHDDNKELGLVLTCIHWHCWCRNFQEKKFLSFVLTVCW